MSILLGVIALFAILSLIVAANQAATIVRLAPAGQHLGSYMLFGWWKFNQIQAKSGPGSDKHLQIYKRATIAFLVFIVLGVAISGWTVGRPPAPAAVTTGSLSVSVPDANPAKFTFDIHTRRVAPMPGTHFLES